MELVPSDYVGWTNNVSNLLGGELPGRLESDWRMFVLCEMWKKKHRNSRWLILTVWSESRRERSHFAAHGLNVRDDIKYATRWQQGVNKSHRMRIKPYEGQDGDFYPAVLSNRCVGRNWKRRNGLTKIIAFCSLLIQCFLSSSLRSQLPFPVMKLLSYPFIHQLQSP